MKTEYHAILEVTVRVDESMTQCKWKMTSTHKLSNTFTIAAVDRPW